MDKRLLAASAAAAMWIAAGSASATNLFDPTVDSCTTTNCGAVILDGSIVARSPQAASWVAELYGNAGCMRIAVTQASGNDTELVVVAPNGTVYRDDDGGGFSNPLIKITNAVNGWYTVRLAHWAGSPISTNFTLAYGRYSSSTNPNCSSPSIGFSPLGDDDGGKE